MVDYENICSFQYILLSSIDYNIQAMQASGQYKPCILLQTCLASLLTLASIFCALGNEKKGGFLVMAASFIKGGKPQDFAIRKGFQTFTKSDEEMLKIRLRAAQKLIDPHMTLRIEFKKMVIQHSTPQVWECDEVGIEISVKKKYRKSFYFLQHKKRLTTYYLKYTPQGYSPLPLQAQKISNLKLKFTELKTFQNFPALDIPYKEKLLSDTKSLKSCIQWFYKNDIQNQFLKIVDFKTIFEVKAHPEQIFEIINDIRVELDEFNIGYRCVMPKIQYHYWRFKKQDSPNVSAYYLCYFGIDVKLQEFYRKSRFKYDFIRQMKISWSQFFQMYLKAKSELWLHETDLIKKIVNKLNRRNSSIFWEKISEFELLLKKQIPICLQSTPQYPIRQLTHKILLKNVSSENFNVIEQHFVSFEGSLKRFIPKIYQMQNKPSNQQNQLIILFKNWNILAIATYFVLQILGTSPQAMI